MFIVNTQINTGAIVNICVYLVQRNSIILSH